MIILMKYFQTERKRNVLAEKEFLQAQLKAGEEDRTRLRQIAEQVHTDYHDMVRRYESRISEVTQDSEGSELRIRFFSLLHRRSMF